MRKRNIQVIFFLNEKENEHLNNIVSKSGLSKSAYLRHLINGLIPSAAPPPDYYKMMRELHYIGNNINQIAYKANALNIIDKDRYIEYMNLFKKTVKEITEAVILPKKNE